MKVLDLFCGAGGAAVGISQAAKDAGIAVEILGIDHMPQPEYPFSFQQKKIEDLPEGFTAGFDFVWASPPCQAFSVATPDKGKHKNYIPLTLSIVRTGCVENVPLAPFRADFVLCGEMFGLRVIRHRKFKTFGFACRILEHPEHRGYSRREPGGGWREDGGYYYETVAGNGCGKDVVKTWREAMGIEHITKKRGIAQAIPPAYSRYIFSEFLRSRGKSE